MKTLNNYLEAARRNPLGAKSAHEREKKQIAADKKAAEQEEKKQLDVKCPSCGHKGPMKQNDYKQSTCPECGILIGGFSKQA